MIKLPRDVNGLQLVKALARLGYLLDWQTGSHMVCTTELKGKHRVSIPNHSPIKPGTLADILDAVAAHFDLSRIELMNRLKL